MDIAKDQILAMLHSQGKHDEANQAGSELPDQVDTESDDHKNLLAKFGVDPSEIAGKLGGLGKLI